SPSRRGGCAPRSTSSGPSSPAGRADRPRTEERGAARVDRERARPRGPRQEARTLESVTILRELWRLKVAVIIVGVLSLLVGYAIAYEFKVPPTPRSYTVGVASARILVDTPNSQVVEVAPKGSETLGARANVLANLMIDGTIKDEIAQRAGLRPDELVTGSLATGGAAEDHKLTADSYALTTGVVLNSD